MSCSDLFQANLIILKQTQSNQANDTANENDSASVNANAVTAQCAVGDPGRSLCSSRCTTRTQLPFSVSKALWRSGGVLRGFGEVGVQTGGDVVLEVSVEELIVVEVVDAV